MTRDYWGLVAFSFMFRSYHLTKHLVKVRAMRVDLAFTETSRLTKEVIRNATATKSVNQAR